MVICMDYREFSSFLSSLSGCELVGLAALLSVAISTNLNCDEVDVLGNFFSALALIYLQLLLQMIIIVYNKSQGIPLRDPLAGIQRFIRTIRYLYGLYSTSYLSKSSFCSLLSLLTISFFPRLLL